MAADAVAAGVLLPGVAVVVDGLLPGVAVAVGAAANVKNAPVDGAAGVQLVAASLELSHVHAHVFWTPSYLQKARGAGGQNTKRQS